MSEWEGVYSVPQLNPALLALCPCCTFIIHGTFSYSSILFVLIALLCFVLIWFFVPKKACG